jgi:uncharacterized protein
MYTHSAEHCIAFDGQRRIANGDILSVGEKVKLYLERAEQPQILVFDAETSYLVELDLRGTTEHVLGRLRDRLKEAGIELPDNRSNPRRPGRPKLGVIGREVTLLPRHWQWLEEQPGGASVTLRKLVDKARKEGLTAERLRRAQEAVYRFMNAMAGDLPGFEEALRALYACDRIRFEKEIATWPRDIRRHVRDLGLKAFSQQNCKPPEAGDMDATEATPG